jgi:hypothetical protein
MKPADTTRFRGLNNVSDPLTLGLSWLRRADNIQITDAGRIAMRPGFSLHAAGTRITGAFASRDERRAYLVDAGTLRTFDGAVVATGLQDAPMHWAEVNQQTYFSNGTDSGIIAADGALLPWRWPVPPAPTIVPVTGSLAAGWYRAFCSYILPDGRETGPSDPVELVLGEGQALLVSGIPVQPGHRTRTYICPANGEVFQLARSHAEETAFVWNTSPDALGRECSTIGMDPLPAGATVIQHWRGRMYAAVPGSGFTAIYRSQALATHLFDLEDYLPVVGDVLMLAPTPGALLIGTATEIHAIDAEGNFSTLAPYGVVPGPCWDYDENEDGAEAVLMWTARGLCRAMPFRNLTAGHVSVAPGVHAGGAVVAAGGQRHFVAFLHAGGSAFNPRS